MIYRKKRGDPDFNKKKEVLAKFLKEESLSKTKLAAELKFLKMLLKDNSLDFFHSEFAIDFKLNSLLWFFTSKGKEALRAGKARAKLEFKESETYNLAKEKVGEDKVIERSPKNLKDFLLHGKNKTKNS